jgi:uncharacterized protein YhdP
VRRLPGILLATGATLIVIVALLISGLRLALPELNNYRPQLLAKVESLSGVPYRSISSRAVGKLLAHSLKCATCAPRCPKAI